MSLRRGVTIRAQIIDEPSIMQNRYLVVLRYREGGDEKELSPRVLGGYTNVSLVVEAEATPKSPFVVRGQHMVIEMWSFPPGTKRKICRLWRIGAADASMKILLEDLGGRFLGEREVALSNEQVLRLRELYDRLLGTFLERLKGLPGTT